MHLCKKWGFFPISYP
jgi:hypothetical protein